MQHDRSERQGCLAPRLHSAYVGQPGDNDHDEVPRAALADGADITRLVDCRTQQTADDIAAIWCSALHISNGGQVLARVRVGVNRSA